MIETTYYSLFALEFIKNLILLHHKTTLQVGILKKLPIGITYLKSISIRVLTKFKNKEKTQIQKSIVFLNRLNRQWIP